MSVQITPEFLRQVAENAFRSQYKTPDQAHAILEGIAKGDTETCEVATEQRFFSAYLTLLGQRAAEKHPATPCRCLNADSVRRYVHRQYDLPTLVRIAHHLGHCQECNDFFWEVEQEPK